MRPEKKDSRMITRIHLYKTAFFMALTLGFNISGVLAALPGGGGAGEDICANVVPVSLASGDVIVLAGDNSSATATGDFTTGSLFNGASVVWHAFTTTECMNVTFDLCGQTPTWENTWGFLFNSCPGNEPTGPNGFNPALCGDGNTTFDHYNLPAGTWYLAVPQLDGSIGAYSINLTGTACPAGSENDSCSDVTPVALGSDASIIFTGDNSGATSTGDFVPGTLDGAPVAWHAITITSCNNIIVSYCGTDPAWSNALGMLLSTCPGDPEVGAPLTNFNSTDCADGNPTFFFDGVLPGTYYIPVLSDIGTNSSGPYTITVSAISCGGLPNDQCFGLTPELLYAGVTLVLTGDNSAATSTNDFVEESIFFGTPVAWHAIQTTACSEITVSYCGQEPTWENTLGILTTSCPGDELVNTTGIDVVTCGDDNTIYTYTDLPEGTYYLPILNDPFNSSSGPYEVTVTAVLCSPLGINEQRQLSWSIFPNPSEGTFTLINGSDMEIISVELMDLSGRVVNTYSTRIAPQASHAISATGLASGMYTVRITNRADQQNTQRMMIR